MKYSLTLIVFFINLSYELELKISIIHVNDGHCYIDAEEFKPIDEDETFLLNKMHNIVELIQKHIDDDKAAGNIDMTLVLNTGSFTTRKWSSKTIGLKSVELLNQMNINYSAFGHYGFSMKDKEGAENFIKTLNFPILCATLNDEMEGVASHAIVTVESKESDKVKHKVALIGYFTPHFSLELANQVNFSLVADRIQKLAEELREKEDLKTVIALGHFGQNFEDAFSKYCTAVDIFIGTHSTLFSSLFNHFEKYYPMWFWEEYDYLYERVSDMLQIRSLSKYVAKMVLTVDTYRGYIVEVVSEDVPYDKRQLNEDIQEEIANEKKEETEPNTTVTTEIVTTKMTSPNTDDNVTTESTVATTTEEITTQKSEAEKENDEEEKLFQKEISLIDNTVPISDKNMSHSRKNISLGESEKSAPKMLQYPNSTVSDDSSFQVLDMPESKYGFLEKRFIKTNSYPIIESSHLVFLLLVIHFIFNIH